VFSSLTSPPSRYQYYYYPTFTNRQAGIGTSVLRLYASRINLPVIDLKGNNRFLLELPPGRVRVAGPTLAKKNALAARTALR
jgi:hypothetical protein